MKKFQQILPRISLVAIHKPLLRPLLDYGGINYEQPHNVPFCEKLESVEYKAALAITGAIQGTSRNKTY